MSERITKQPKSKQEIIDQVGRITTKLHERAGKLSQMKDVYVRPSHNGNVMAPVFSNLGLKRMVGQIGSSEAVIENDTQRGSKSLRIKTIESDGAVKVHEAKARRKDELDYGYDRSNTSFAQVSTASAETKTEVDDKDDEKRYETQSVSGNTRTKDSFMDKDFMYKHRDDELYTKTPDLGYRSDTEMLLGRKVEDHEKDAPEELSKRAISQSAETLAAIRGTIANAEIDQKRTKADVARVA